MDQPNRISGLEALLKSQSGTGPAPVEAWNPPYCGDIGMAIRSDGVWMYQNSPIGRMPLVKLFARVLRRDADDKYYLVTPAEKIDVSVVDAPFLAVEMEVRNPGPDQSLVFRTNVDDVVTCGPDHGLRFVEESHSGGLKPYLRVRGRLDALVTRALYYDLVELAVADTDGTLHLRSGGATFAIQAATVQAGSPS
jgi:uncharacterized protein